MIESDHVVVDTNVLLDVIEADPQWLEWSLAQMSRFPSRLIINPLIYTELCDQATSIDEVAAMVEGLGLQYHELPQEALFLAAQAYKGYRRQGGVKTSPLADFFIGAHASVLSLPILTRDTSRYRTYFHGVVLIAP